MKKIIITLCVLFAFVGNCVAQKQKNDKPPTAAEMKKMMAEAQKQLDNLDPKTKRMMDSMGMKMPNLNTKQLDKITDKDLAKDWNKNTGILPNRNEKKIASISKEIITSNNILPYLQNIHTAISNKLNTKTKSDAEKIIAQIKVKYKENLNYAMASYASILWIKGKQDIALYLMGTACINNPKNLQNLNNYCAFITMGGAAEIVIPILDKLNKDVPNNSVVLNNLGQAWFALGSMERANLIFQSCLAVDPENAQANNAKSLLEESKGNKQVAVSLLRKSIQAGYSEEKRNRLEKLGYKITKEDIPWEPKKIDDGLGMSKFVHPPYPKSVAEWVKLEPEWMGFEKSVDKEIIRLETNHNELDKKFKEEQHVIQQKRLANTNNIKQEYTSSSFYEKVNKKWEFTIPFTSAKRALLHKRYTHLNEEIILLEKECGEKLSKVAEIRATVCKNRDAINSEFMYKANTLIEQNGEAELAFIKAKFNEHLSYYIYMFTATEFEMLKNRFKIEWLKKLKSPLVEFIEYGAFQTMQVCEASKAAIIPTLGKLANWEDINCTSTDHTIMWVPTVGRMYTECNKMKIDIEIEIEGFGGKYNGELDFISGDQKGTLFIGYSKGFMEDITVKEFKEGTVAAPEAKLEGGAFIEISNGRIADAGLKGEAKLEASHIKGFDGHSTSTTAAGIEGTLSWNSGISSTGTGILEGLGTSKK
jgi:tetratricopeptide (TPR) repeat protein